MRQVLCPRIVGRDEELRAITTALDAATDGRGQTLFLVGEPGVGKSRLTREAEELARARGMRTLRGRGAEGSRGTAAAYRPLIEALLSSLRREPLASLPPELRPFRTILGRLIPDWRETGAASVDES